MFNGAVGTLLDDTSTLVDVNEAVHLLNQIPGWYLSWPVLSRKFSFSDMQESADFANKVTILAELENHFPDVFLSEHILTVKLMTSDAGLSVKDFMFAAKINRMLSKFYLNTEA